jgi:hypothetical protein
MADNLNDELSFWDQAKPVIAGQIRHVFTGAGVFLVAHHALDPSASNSFVEIFTGFVMYGIGAGWSWAQKVFQVRATASLQKFKDLVTAQTAYGTSVAGLPPGPPPQTEWRKPQKPVVEPPIYR